MDKKEMFWTLLGGALIIMIPAIIMIIPYINDIFVWFSINTKDLMSVVMNITSIMLCCYCLIRTIIGVVANVFLPKIPMPRNRLLRIILMASIGIFVGVVSSVTTLTLWVITCFLGMATFSFVETYEGKETV